MSRASPPAAASWPITFAASYASAAGAVAESHRLRGSSSGRRRPGLLTTRPLLWPRPSRSAVGATASGEFGQALKAAGIDEDDGAAARDFSRETAEEAALRFARRKRIGPFGPPPSDRRESERAMAAMMRAGHGFELAKRVLALPPDFDSEA